MSIHSTEQASWDSYQEKYLSEPYSEDPPDPEAARRLLEFGDDYRAFLDSDCASSLSTNPNGGSPGGSPPHRRRVRPGREDADSDSDLEELRRRVGQSRAQYERHGQVFDGDLTAATILILGRDYADFFQTCSENSRCLNDILEDQEVRARLTPQERRDIAGLARGWGSLQGRADKLLRRDMDALRDELLRVRGAALGAELGDMDQLDERISAAKDALEAVKDRRRQRLAALNLAVHRCGVQAPGQAPGQQGAQLRDQLTELYRLYDDTEDMLQQQLQELQQTRASWTQFEQHLQELRLALRQDQEALQQVDRALQSGAVSPAVASSVREVARALSEKHEGPAASSATSSVPGEQSSLVVLADAQTAALRYSEGGSLSDSGISDTGSDQEASERERRLAGLRRLARQLEAVLRPGSSALDGMRERILQAEAELRGLQRACRDLIVRTAVCASRAGPAAAAAATETCKEAPGGPRARTSGSRRCRRRASPADPDDPGEPPHWLWRAVRAALPFQLALVALLCVACLLQPHCCDHLNNLSLSLSPQLRYARGPPPV